MKKRTILNLRMRRTFSITSVCKIVCLLLFLVVLSAESSLLRANVSKNSLENETIISNQNKAPLSQQKSILKGSVTDEKGVPLVGVSILIKGTTKGVDSDIDGNFSIDLSKMLDATLVFVYIGMEQKEVFIKEIKPDMKPLKIVMKEINQNIDEVVVTGIFNRRKEGFTGSAVTVKGEDLIKVSTTNIAKSLSSLDPSFRVMTDEINGSNPNKLPDLRVRGQATIPSGTTASSDLVSLQGEYDTYPNKPLIIQDGFEISLQALVDLDPDRVATITLLKDAAATAIYGARAANGVIVIETKAPKVGKLWVTYSGNARVEAPDLRDYNLMNAKEKLEAEKLAGIYDASNGSLEPLEIYQSKYREVLRGVDTYWLDKPLRTSIQQRHSVSMEGGDTFLRYKLYLGANFSPGVMKGSERNTLTGALDLQYRFNKILLKNSVSVENAVGNESPYGSFADYTRLNPYLRPYGENGEILKRLDTFDMLFRGSTQQLSYANPMYNAQLNIKNRSEDFLVRNIFSVEYSPISDLRLVASFSLAKNNGKTDVFKPAQHTDFDYEKDPTKRGSFRRTQRDGLNYALDLTGSYNKLFKDTHYVTANARYSLFENSNYLYGAYVTGFPNQRMDDILFGKKYNENMSGSENTSRLLAFSGSFGYSYKFKYSADFNISVNGSSQFGKDNLFAPFWSAGLRWDVKKENFMENVKFISSMVLRTSYGVTGTQGFAPYQSRELYSYNNLLRPYLSSDAIGAELVAMPNKKLKWQETGTWNLGLELGFLKGRITARTEVFNKTTTNLLTQITLAPSLGFSSFPQNLGMIENKGVEFTLGFIPYQNTAKQAYWTISFNGSHNRDKLKKISNAMKKMNDINSESIKEGKTNVPLPRYVEGESLNGIWAVRSLGIDPSTGKEILLKRDGSMTGVYDVVDFVSCGLTEPKWQGNINSSFSYRGFGIDMFFSFRYGGQIFNSTLMDKVENADLVYNADRRVLDLRWKQVGDITRYQSISKAENGSSSKVTSRFIMDDNTFQMGSLSVSYRMDKNNAKYIEKWGVSSIKLGFNMEDILYLSTVKRERGTAYPFSRRFAVSLNIGF